MSTENDLGNVHVGETAEIRLTAYPDKVFSGRISNIGPVLDPALRTAKVRIEVHIPASCASAMFVTATFHGLKKNDERLCLLRDLHLHDRDWPLRAGGDKKFRRVEVVAGRILPDKTQEIISGISLAQASSCQCIGTAGNGGALDTVRILAI